MDTNIILRLIVSPTFWMWAGALVLLLATSRQLCVRRVSLQELIRSECGASYSLNLALVTPLYTLMICFLVELTLLLNVQMGVDYAACSAARAAIVWLPAEVTPRNNQQQMADMVHLAAGQAMTPYASSLQDHQRTDAVPDPGGEEAYVSAYSNHVTESSKQPASYVTAKRRYAMAATHVEYEPALSTLLNDRSRSDRLVKVTVHYEMPFNIPGVGRILGRRSSQGPGYVRDVSSSVTLELERPKSRNGRPGWEYDSRPAL